MKLYIYNEIKLYFDITYKKYNYEHFYNDNRLY